jgi:hypothetical protein
VLVPLVAGVVLRAVWPRLGRGEPWFAASSTLAVVVLIYAALSGTSGGEHIVPALLASGAFLAVSGLPALAGASLVSGQQRPAVAFAAWLRDFAVAATLATQAFGPPAATVAGVYGVLMLIAGAMATSLLRRRTREVQRHTAVP